MTNSKFNPTVDEENTAHDLNHGRGSQIITTLDHELNPQIENGFYIVKHAGETKHREFNDDDTDEFIDISATHHFQVSKEAKSKVGLLVSRRTTLSIMKELIGAQSHTHHAPPLKLIEKFLAAATLGFEDRSIKSFTDIFKISADKRINEYIYTNIESTFVQKEPTSEKLDTLIERKGITALNGDDCIDYFRAPDSSVIFMAGRVFHRAPLSDEIALESFGKDRSFMDLMYLPTR